jgi:hypothetical protein
VTDYYVMKGFAEAQVIVLYSLKDPGPSDNWMLARRFSVPVPVPVEVTVVPDNEEGILLPFYGAPQIMRKDLYETLVGVGVDNIDVYKAVVKREDGVVISEDYLAYNILGAMRAADLTGTRFAPENPSRMIDASIEKLLVSETRVKGLLLFRLAESIRTIVVHAKVRKAIEARAIPYIVFLGADDRLF